MRQVRYVVQIGLSLVILAHEPGAAARANTPAQSTAAPPPMAGMAVVPAGDYWMGRVRLWLIDEIGWQVRERADDRPLHLVHLDAFAIDVHEVTNAAYGEFVAATGRRAPYHWRGGQPPADRGTMPVYNVSWHDAVAYCAWKGKRLPTESEWEKASRGGLDRQDFPWGMEYDAAPSGAGGQSDTPPAGGPGSAAAAAPRPNAWSNSALGPTAVGSFAPNGYGVYDMSGNVWEWTADWYDLFAYSVAERRNPTGPATGQYKVIRGGGWSESESRLGTVYHRNFANPDLKAPTVGFRCAASVPD
ncbi:MAG: formylglycine-generating enzyme family protein [Acidobacteriota bacterium]